MAIQSTAKYQLQKIVLTMANALGQENAGAIAITKGTIALSTGNKC